MEIDDILSEDEQPDYWDSGWAHEGEKMALLHMPQLHRTTLSRLIRSQKD